MLFAVFGAFKQVELSPINMHMGGGDECCSFGKLLASC